jgi:protocatechuate 3,4-dioxygenase beta subunit
LKKVAIRIFSDDEENSYPALSDAEGHFKIEDVKPGHYNVHIEHNGFLETEKHGRRYRDETLTLEPGQELKDLVFRMRPGALITGKIIDAEGDPILKASVQVFRQHSGSPR